MKINNLINRRITKFCKRTMALTLALLLVMPSIMYSMSNGFISVKAYDFPYTGATLVDCFPGEDRILAKYIYEEILGHNNWDSEGEDYVITGDDFTVLSYQVTSIDLSGKGTADLTGIQSFSSFNILDELNLSNNSYTSLPSDLPSSIEELDLSGNDFSSVPYLPSKLTSLDMSDNYLESITRTLPSTLTTLNVSGNSLNSLPGNLPSKLSQLHVENNQLTSLPDNLPSTLSRLYAENNQLTSIPELPTGLRYLYLQNNKLKELDLSNLENLYDQYTNVSGQTPQFEYIAISDSNYKILDVPTENVSDIMINSTAYNDYDNSGSITVDTLPTSFTYNYNTGCDAGRGLIEMDVTAVLEEVTLTSVEVKTPPTKTNYIEGNKFDPTGLVLTLHYDNDTTEEVTYNTSTKDDFEFSPNLNTALETTNEEVEISYGGQSVKQSITVSEKSVDTVTIKTQPTKKTYIEGNKFDPAGLKITLHYDNGTTEDVTYSESNKTAFTFTPSVDTALKTEDTTVSVEYNGITAEQTIPITVNARTLQTISIKNTPRISYAEGEKFDPTGLVITLNYNNDTSEEVTYDTSTKDNFEFSPNLNTPLETTNEEVEIRYGGKSVKQSITVSAKSVDTVTITTQPTKTTYIEGNKFDPTGLVITLHYDNDTTQEVTYSEANKTSFTFTPSVDTALKTEDTTVSVEYNGTTAEQTIPITVNARTLQTITVNTPPTKTTYIEGQNFDPTGLVITLHYDNNTTEDVTYSESNKTAFEFTPGLTTALQTSDSNVVIEYGGKAVSQSIKVNAKTLQTISIKNAPTKTLYIAGEKFDPTGLVITLNYDNNTSEDVTYNDSTKNNFSFSTGLNENLTADIDKVTITYAEKTAEQDINVVELSSISIKNAPRTLYAVGEKFDPTGLVITLNYEGQITKDVAYDDSTKDDFTFSPDLNTSLQASHDKVTVTYAEKAAEQDINVVELTSISIKNPPAKTLYAAGEKFDPTDLVITLNYEDQITKDVTYNDSTKDDFTFSPDLNTALQASHDKVTVTYAGKTTEQGIPIKVFNNTTLTDEGNGVTISGSLEENASLTVSEIDTSHDNYSSLLESLGDGKKVLLAVDVSIENGTYKPGDNLTLTFEVDPIYNGRTATIKHLLSSGLIETYPAIVIDGKIQIIVTELSPFMIAIDEDPVTDENNDYNADSDDYGVDSDDYYYASIYQTGDNAPILALFAIIASSVMVISGYIMINRKKFLQK